MEVVAAAHLIRIRTRARRIDRGPAGLGCASGALQKKQDLPSRREKDAYRYAIFSNGNTISLPRMRI